MSIKTFVGNESQDTFSTEREQSTLNKLRKYAFSSSLFVSKKRNEKFKFHK